MIYRKDQTMQYRQYKILPASCRELHIVGQDLPMKFLSLKLAGFSLHFSPGYLVVCNPDSSRENFAVPYSVLSGLRLKMQTKTLSYKVLEFF
jgi:hypothetical protein